MAIKKLTNKECSGKYVATRSFNDKKVIASGKDPEKVIAKAEKICKSPVIFFVPRKNAIHIY